jgi:phytol kinase
MAYTSFGDLIYDIIVLVIVFVFVFAVIGIGEVLRKRRGLDPSFTRKVIHFFAGDAILFCPFFKNPQIIVVIPLVMAIVIFLSSPKSPIASMRSMFEVMARTDDYKAGHIYGPLYYIISIGVLVAVFAYPAAAAYWPLFTLAGVGLFAMYYGDGLATIIGMRWGKHKYTVGKSTRSVEGSVTVFLMTVVSAFIVVYYFKYFGFWPSFPSSQFLIIWLLYSFSPTSVLASYLALNLLTSTPVMVPIINLIPSFPSSQFVIFWLLSSSSPIFATFFALWIFTLMPPFIPVINLILVIGIVAGVVATVIEGLSQRELDNIFVPMITTAVIFVLVLLLFPGYLTVSSFNLASLLPI